MSGEFAAGAKLPNEQDLAQRLGLSRNSLREAVRALTLIGVLEPRVGDGTYVTSLEPELLLTGMGFISDLLTGTRCSSCTRCGGSSSPSRPDGGDAARRGRLRALERCLAQMDAAETTQAFIAADEEFHRIIVDGVRELDARLADPEPLGRDAACAPLAVGDRAGRGRGDEAAPHGTSTTRSRPRRRARGRRRPHQPVWEERWHPLREEWVIVAAHRQDRPWSGELAASSATTCSRTRSRLLFVPGERARRRTGQSGLRRGLRLRQRSAVRRQLCSAAAHLRRAAT